MKNRFLTFSLALLSSCGVATEDAADPGTEQAHQRTQIPFNIDNFSPEQTAVIRAANADDTSSYLMRSRPVVFQIVVTGNDADETRHGGPIEQPAEVMIYALGEADGARLVDYAWLENAENGATVWKMTPENSVHAGGDRRNRKAVAQLTLPRGTYRLRYVTNATHAYPDWRGEPPERQRMYGVTVFNLQALPRLEARLQRAGVPGLESSLRSK